LRETADSYQRPPRLLVSQCRTDFRPAQQVAFGNYPHNRASAIKNWNTANTMLEHQLRDFAY